MKKVRMQTYKLISVKLRLRVQNKGVMNFEDN